MPAAGRAPGTSRGDAIARTMLGSTTTSVGPPIIKQMFDIVAPDQNKPAAAVDAGMIDHREPRLASARIVAEASGAESPQRPRDRADQSQHDQECQEEAYGERHLRSQQTVHPHYSPFRLGAAAVGPQKLTAPEILAAVITNKQLKIIAEFHDKADG